MSTESMAGRTCMITGASSGIGRAAALHLAARGAKLILVCRDRERGENTIHEIEKKTGTRDVRLMLADLSSQTQVKRLGQEFLDLDEPLHVLVNNAGIFNLKFEESVDGIEKVYATNHLGYFILTEILLERLEQSAPARIVIVTSRGHKWAQGIEPLTEATFNPFHAYGGSKLSNILYTYDLARRLEGTGVTVNCTHPGDIATGLARNNKGWPELVLALARPYFRGVDRGAETPVYLASSPAVAKVTGKYFVSCKPKRSSRESYDRALGRRLQAMSYERTGLGRPEASPAASPTSARQGATPEALPEFDAEMARSAYELVRKTVGRYFRMQVIGAENLPDEGRCMVVGCHSGVIPYDAACTLVAIEQSTGRLGRSLGDRFFGQVPAVEAWLRRLGAVVGDPEITARCLEEEHLMLVFPGGAKDMPRPYWRDRYRVLPHRGYAPGHGGYIKIALRTGSPIVPLAVVGAEEAHVVLGQIPPLAKLIRVPFAPVVAFGWPLPVKIYVRFGEPIAFDRDPEAADDQGRVDELNDRVRLEVQKLIDDTRKHRKGIIFSHYR